MSGNNYMEDITKWFAAPEGVPAFEIPVLDREEAVRFIKRRFNGSGEVRLIESTFRHLTSTPSIIET